MFTQNKLPQLKERKIRYMVYNEEVEEFYFVVSKDYDKYLSVERSQKSDMVIRFSKPIEPDTLNICDFHITTTPNSTGCQNNM